MLRLGSILICTVAILTASAHAQIVIEQDTVIGDRDTSVHGQDVIVRGATLTINGVHPLASLTVERNASNQPGIVTHSPGFSNRDVNGMSLIVDGDLFVQGADDRLQLVASRIDVSGRGHGPNEGPGAGQPANDSGGGAHGGAGGAGGPGSGAGGAAYGLVHRPADEFGSGSGDDTCCRCTAPGRPGGGVIKIVASAAIRVVGAVVADGEDGTCQAGGGGGGAIVLSAPTIELLGEISARGGDGGSDPPHGMGGGGGGGRVAVFTDHLIASASVEEQVCVDGGSGWNDGNAGTRYLPVQYPGDLNGDLVVNGADVAILLANWAQCNDCDDCLADLNGDCQVDGADLAVLLANWGSPR